MNKTKLTYFEKEDILHLAISNEPKSGSIEINPSITAELNGKGELKGKGQVEDEREVAPASLSEAGRVSQI